MLAAPALASSLPTNASLDGMIIDGSPAAWEKLAPPARDDAHRDEHSLEVQLPFLYRRRPDVEILPVCIRHLGLDDCLALGRCLAEIIADSDEPVVSEHGDRMAHHVSQSFWASEPPMISASSWVICA